MPHQNYTVKCGFIDTENKLHGLMIHKLVLKSEMALLYSTHVFRSSKLSILTLIRFHLPQR